MVIRGIGWVFLLTGLAVIIYFLGPGSSITYEVTAIYIFLFGVPFFILGTAILIFSKD